jgi:hypothetical protein
VLHQYSRRVLRGPKPTVSSAAWKFRMHRRNFNGVPTPFLAATRAACESIVASSHDITAVKH